MDSVFTMKVLILVVCTFHLTFAKNQAMDRSTHCESCLRMAQEIEKTLKASPAESRRAVLRSLLSGEVCESPALRNRGVHSKHTMTSSCKQLLADHHEQFSEALINKEPKGLEMTLCYEQSSSCVGVKRHSFQNSKVMFEDEVLQDLFEKHKGNMRISRPMRTNSASKDEL